MANQILEGWDTYATGDASSALAGSTWLLSASGTSGPAITNAEYANGTRSLLTGTAVPKYVYKAIADNNIYCFGYRARIGTFGISGYLSGVGLSGATATLSLSFNENALPVLVRGTTIIWTGPNPVANNTWQYIDCIYNRTAGTCDIFLNGNFITQVTGVVSIGAIQQARVGGVSSQTGSNRHANFYIDDIYFNSGNERWGDIGAVLLMPNADLGGNTWSVVGTASGFQVLDNVPFNPAQYLEAVNVGDISAFNIPETPLGTFQVFSVQHRYVAQKSSAGVSDMRGFLQINAASYAGSTVSLVQGTYTTYQDEYLVNPATGLPWVPADFIGGNVALGYERIA